LRKALPLYLKEGESYIGFDRGGEGASWEKMSPKKKDSERMFKV